MKRRVYTLLIVVPALVALGGLAALVIGDAPRTLGAFTTSLEGRTPEQVHNMRRAAGALDGVTLRPGEEFSFNKAVGERSVCKGYARAGTIVEGRPDDGAGGGICQLSSTLYNAALLAGLEITERHPHSSPVRSVPPGRDATVAFGRQDLRFANNLSHAVSLRITVSDRRLMAGVLGNGSDRRNLRIAVETGTSPHPGGSRVISATVWREELPDGRVAGREFISSDTYGIAE